MYNFFTHRRHLESTEAQQRKEVKSARNEVVHEQRRDELRKVAIGRAVEWAGKHMTPEYVKTVRAGGVMLKHPSAHQFRVTPEESAKSIYVRNYQPAKDRAKAAETDYTSSHLGVSYPYDINSPNTHTDWVRKPDPSGFLFSSRTAYKNQDDESRLKTSASDQRLVELQGFDKYEVVFHKFRTRAKTKEIDLTEFTGYVRKFDRSSSAWTTPKIYDGEPYVDGFAVTGDLSKHRDKSKEVNAQDFTLTSPKDPWRKWTSPGQSLREQKSEDQLKKLDLVRSTASVSTKTSPKGSSAPDMQKYYVKTFETQKALGLAAPVRRVSTLNAGQDSGEKTTQAAGVVTN